MGKYKKLDFIKVLKTLAQRSLDEKWYNVSLDIDHMQFDCPFCFLAKQNYQMGYKICKNCVLNQFINKKIIDICSYISNVNPYSGIKLLQHVKDNIIYWLEQIAKHGTIFNIRRNIIGSGSVNDQYEFNRVKKYD